MLGLKKILSSSQEKNPGRHFAFSSLICIESTWIDFSIFLYNLSLGHSSTFLNSVLLICCTQFHSFNREMLSILGPQFGWASMTKINRLCGFNKRIYCLSSTGKMSRISVPVAACFSLRVTPGAVCLTDWAAQ